MRSRIYTCIQVKKKERPNDDLPDGEELNVTGITIADFNGLGARVNGALFLVLREHEVDELASVRSDEASLLLGSGGGTVVWEGDG